jgi:hypothetical protein
MQLTLANVLRATPGTSGAPQQQQQALPLPPPISPVTAAEADIDPFCAESAALQQYATNSTGWAWNLVSQAIPCPHSNCNTLGFSTSGAGKTLQLTIDTQQNNTRGAPFERRSLVGIFFASKASNWWGRMGVAQLACVCGCACKPAIMTVSTLRSQGENLWGTLAISKTEVR